MTGYKIIKNSSYFSRYTVKSRRLRSNKINKKLKKKSKELGKLQKTPLFIVIRISNVSTVVILKYHSLIGDNVVEMINSIELDIFGSNLSYKNLITDYFIGLLFSKRILLKFAINYINSFKTGIDLGFHKIARGGNISSIIKGIYDGGILISHSKNIMKEMTKVEDAILTNDSSGFITFFLDFVQRKSTLHEQILPLLNIFVDNIVKVHIF
mmetsp:Transcript_19013/g.46695  ORF Transcript_19013/g.46695 Transcript_19013/m.46695 type:complete len:211 (-) Transcript_19013:2584-3216(-)